MNGCKKCDEHTYVEEFDYEYDGDDENERWGIVPCSNCNSSKAQWKKVRIKISFTKTVLLPHRSQPLMLFWVCTKIR